MKSSHVPSSKGKFNVLYLYVQSYDSVLCPYPDVLYWVSFIYVFFKISCQVRKKPRHNEKECYLATHSALKPNA